VVSRSGQPRNCANAFQESVRTRIEFAVAAASGPYRVLRVRSLPAPASASQAPARSGAISSLTVSSRPPLAARAWARYSSRYRRLIRQVVGLNCPARWRVNAATACPAGVLSSGTAIASP
jgi:hypothetical protein